MQKKLIYKIGEKLKGERFYECQVRSGGEMDSITLYFKEGYYGIMFFDGYKGHYNDTYAD